MRPWQAKLDELLRAGSSRPVSQSARTLPAEDWRPCGQKEAMAVAAAAAGRRELSALTRRLPPQELPHRTPGGGQELAAGREESCIQ